MGAISIEISWNQKSLIYPENNKSNNTTWNTIWSFSVLFWIMKEVDNAGVPKSKRDITLMSSNICSHITHYYTWIDHSDI